MIKDILKSDYHEAWHKFHASPLQSWYWGELKSDRWEIERLGIYDKKELVSILTVFKRKFPLSSLTRLFNFESFAYIPRGVAVKNLKYFKKVLSELSKHLQIQKVGFVLIDPDNNLLEENWNQEFEKALESEGWEVVGTSIEPNQTNVVEIDRGDEELFAAMKPKWRRNIKKAKRHGVEVREICDRSSIDGFYSVISEVEKKTKFRARSKGYFQRMWDILSQDGLIRIFHAIYEEDVVASYLVLITDNAAYEIYGGATQKGRDLEAAYLLKWEIMRTMRTGGRAFYDHWGVAPKESKDHPLSGISYFKEGFGGKYVQFLPQYVKVFSPLAYLGYKMFGRK